MARPRAARNMANNKNKLLGEIRRQNNFILKISGVTTGGDIPNDLTLIVSRAFLPKVSNQVLELRHGNETVKFAGVASWEGGEIAFHDVLNQDELDAVIEWHRKTYDPKTGNIGLASEYKKNGTVTELAPNGEFRRQWSLNGMWISSRDLGILDSSNGELKQVSFTIQIDPSSTLSPKYSKYPEGE